MFASDGDAVILLEDAVLAIGSVVTLRSFLAKCQSQGVQVFALENDAVLRGIENRFDDVCMTDYAGFVELAVQHDKQVAW